MKYRTLFFLFTLSFSPFFLLAQVKSKKEKDNSFIKLSEGVYNLTIFGKINSETERPLPNVFVTIYEVKGKGGLKNDQMLRKQDMSLIKKGEVKTNNEGKITIAVDFNKEYVLMFSRPSFYQSTVVVNTRVPRVDGMSKYYFITSLKYFKPDKIGKDSGNVEKMVFYDKQTKKFSILQKGNVDTLILKKTEVQKKTKTVKTVPIADTFKTTKVNNKSVASNKSKPVSKGVVLFDNGTSAEILNNDTVNRIDVTSKRQGNWLYVSKADSSRIYSGPYDNDLKSGVWNKYFPNDSIEMQMFYKNNTATGDFRMFYNNGKLKSKGVWDSDSKGFNGKFELYHPNGNIYKNYQYDELGGKSGTQLLYYSSGKLAVVSQMDKGKLNGQTMLFLEDGTAYSERTYSNGMMISEKKLNPSKTISKSTIDELMFILQEQDTSVINQMRISMGELETLDGDLGSILKERDAKLIQANKIIDKQKRELLINYKKISRIELENKLKSEKLSRQRTLSLFGTLLTLAMIVIIIIVVRNSRAKQKVNTLLNIQKNEILVKNREITDSINYAKRIQQAFLPGKNVISGLIPDSFVLYKPKDIVSGDFYWTSLVSNSPREVIIIVADSTGHGVPGAFMSIVGASLLNQIIIEKEITKPGLILEELNRGVKHSLQQSMSENRDGIDIALCKLCHDEKSDVWSIEFSGAMRPLLIINGSEIIEIAPSKRPIAGHTEDDYKYKTHTQVVKKGSAVYLFSDGYSDQFGGPEGHKFMSKNFKKLIASIHDQSMETQCIVLEQSFDKWKGDLQQLDDVCVFGFRV